MTHDSPSSNFQHSSSPHSALRSSPLSIASVMSAAPSASFVRDACGDACELGSRAWSRPTSSGFGVAASTVMTPFTSHSRLGMRVTSAGGVSSAMTLTEEAFFFVAVPPAGV